MVAETMRAARFEKASGRLTVVKDVPVPEPGPGDVLVRIEACGVCLSDVHMLDGSLPGPLDEVTPGHEPAGTVVRVGPGVPYWRPGQRVIIAPGRPCGACARCGEPLACAEPRIMGRHYDGAWAEYVTNPYETLVAVPDGVPIEQAAICTDAVASPYAALADRGALRPGERVGIWGIGGLGVHAVQIARLAGAALVVAVDTLGAARARALDAGADHALDPSADDVRAEVLRLTGDEGLDLAAEFSGVGSALDQAVDCLGGGGRAVAVGMSQEPVRLTENTVMFGYRNHSVLGHHGYTRLHLIQLMRLLSTGRLDLSRSISDTLPLEDVGEAVERLRSKEGNPVRIVIKP